MNKIKKNLIYKLREFFDRKHYHLMMTLILGESNYFINPIVDYYTIKREINKVNDEYRDIISFFSLGSPIKKEKILSILDFEILEHLYELNIVDRDESDYWMNNYLITSYCNCYFLVSNVFYYPTNQSHEQKPYIGIDTYWLSRNVVNKTGGLVLDLCTGSGIQGILAAQNANSVIAVDIDADAVKVARFNAVLNYVDNKMEVIQGDLYSAIDNNQQFDYILSNPPFIPIPENVPFPVCGDGGVDGMQIIRNIIKGYSKHLKPHGQAIMIGQAIGNKQRVFLANEMESLAEKISNNLIVSGGSIIENQANNFADLANRLNKNTTVAPEDWLTVYTKLQVEYFYNFTLFSVNDGKGENEVIVLNDTWRKDDIPISKISDVNKVQEIHSVRSVDSNHSLFVDEEGVEFLCKIDGKKSLSEIINTMSFKYRVKYGKNYLNSMISKYSALASVYERNGIIQKLNK